MCALEEDALDIRERFELLSQQLHPTSCWIGIARGEPSMRDGPNASVALEYERDGLLGAEQRRRRGTAALELLELLTIRHLEIVGLC